MNIFLKPFVQNMNKLWDDGIKCKIADEERIIKVFCLDCCVNSVARAPMQGITHRKYSLLRFYEPISINRF